MLLKAELAHEIPFHDVDMLNIVWHGHYIKYFELVRCKLLEAISYDYQAMRDSGYIWPIIDTRVKYIKPLHFTQKVILEAELREWEYRILIHYTIKDPHSGEPFTKGHTSQVAIDSKTGEKCFESPSILELKLKEIGII